MSLDAGTGRARAIVMRHGWNATAYQILNPGIDLWFAPESDAVVGYRRASGVRVVAGAPACPEDRLESVVAAFETDARARGEEVCWFGAEARLERLFRGRTDRTPVLLGAQPVWDPARWDAVVAARASLRAQIRRAARHGVAVAEWDSGTARDHPALLACLKSWLAARGLPPMRFLVEPRTLSRLADRRVFVASLPDGRVAGLLVASPVPARRGWLVEQILRAPGAPNGTAEALVDAAMRAFARDGAAFATLGLAPLSRRGSRGEPRGPLWARALFAGVRRHAGSFYNFRGLEAFKAKLQPDRWDPVFAYAPGPRFRLRHLWAIAGAFGGGSPLAFAARGLARRLRKGA